MDSRILYKSVRIASAYLDYYIIPESISAAYCDLMCYGIKIEKTVLYEGGGKTIETKQINNVFYRRSDADEFMRCAAESGVEPRTLREFVENYILRGLDRAKTKVQETENYVQC